MITDLDIYRSASELIEEYGDDAPIWTAQKVDDMHSVEHGGEFIFPGG